MSKELIERIDAEIRVWNTDCDSITLNRILMKQLSTLLSDCKAALTQQQEALDKFIAGECVCNPSPDKLTVVIHRAFCPVALKDAIAHLQKEPQYEQGPALFHEFAPQLTQEEITEVVNNYELLKPKQEAEPVSCLGCEPMGFSESKDAIRRKYCNRCGGTGMLYRHQAAQPQVVQDIMESEPLGAEFEKAMMKDLASLYECGGESAKPAAQSVDADELSNFIRKIDGNNSMGAGALVENVAERIGKQAALPQEGTSKLVGTIAHLREDEPDLQWEPGKVDPEQVRLALQSVQRKSEFGEGRVIPVWCRLIAAARYAIEKLQAQPQVPDADEMYRRFCAWCENECPIETDTRLHSHSGRSVSEGAYISNPLTSVLFKAYRAGQLSAAKEEGR